MEFKGVILILILIYQLLITDKLPDFSRYAFYNYGNIFYFLSDRLFL